MVLQTYQIQMYQKTPPIIKYTNITQISPNLSKQLENIKSLQKKSTKSKKIIKTLEQPHAVLRNGSSNQPESNGPNDPAHSESNEH